MAAEDKLEISACIGWKLEDEPRLFADRPYAGGLELGPTVPQKPFGARALDERQSLADPQRSVDLAEPDRVNADAAIPGTSSRVESLCRLALRRDERQGCLTLGHDIFRQVDTPAEHAVT